MIQIIIAIAVGGAFGIKIFWRKIYGFFKNLSTKGKKHDKDEKPVNISRVQRLLSTREDIFPDYTKQAF